MSPRDYVGEFWPLDPSPPGSQLEDMYGKILRKMAETSNEAAATNGAPAANGTPATSTAAIKH